MRIQKHFVFVLASLAALAVAGDSRAETVNIAKPGASSQSTATEHSSQSLCPGKDFATFFGRFAYDPALQRKYTTLPLEYGRLDVDLVGTDQEDQAYKTTTIASYEQIPQRNSHNAIFPTRAEMKKEGLRVNLTTKANSKAGANIDPEEVIDDADQATATLLLPDSGFRVHYRFRRAAGCWLLYGISDRSI